MIVQLHGPIGSRELADALATDHDAGTAPQPPWTERSAITLGGPWPLTGWKRHLQEAIASDHPMTALTVRTAPGERLLAPPVWANIAYGLVNASNWTTTPWLAVHTTTHSLVILATTDQRPSASAIRQAADVLHRTNDLIPPADSSHLPDLSTTRPPARPFPQHTNPAQSSGRASPPPIPPAPDSNVAGRSHRRSSP